MRTQAPRTPSGRSRSEPTERILTPDALAFLKALHAEFEPRRRQLLNARAKRRSEIESGARPGFLPETADVRASEWQVEPPPRDLECRWVEIVGPADRRTVVNALNSGADVFIADLGDSLAPTWPNVLEAHAALYDAIRREIDFIDERGRPYRLGFHLAALMIRPRGWHLDEARVKVGGAPMSASLFDFGLHAFHNARELLAREGGPWFYLPQLENRLEARLWNDVFAFTEKSLGLPHGSIRATVLIEHILAAFEMEEILHELRDHALGLAVGRRNYLFSAIKTFGRYAEMTLPDRGDIPMTASFLRAMTELLVRTCHRRGAHAIGTTSTYTCDADRPDHCERAIEAVRQDKERECLDGFDGTVVANPALVPIARAAFGATLGPEPHRKRLGREDVRVGAYDLISLADTDGRVTRVGVELNATLALTYMTAWLRGRGAVTVHDHFEDASAAEVSRSQLWQWVRHEVRLDDGDPLTADRYREIREVVARRLAPRLGDRDGRLSAAAVWLDRLVLADACGAFMWDASPEVASTSPSCGSESPERRVAGTATAR